MISFLVGALSAIVIVAPGPPGGTPAPGAPPVPDLGTGVAAGPGTALSGWKLTVPEAGDRGTAHTVAPSDPDSAPWLSRGSDGGLALWAPVGGATTAHSTHSRTELDSLTSFPAGGGGHLLEASLAIDQLPPTSQDIIVGQIHGAGDLIASAFVMLHYDGGSLRVVVEREPTGSDSVSYPLLTGVPLGARFGYLLADPGDGTVRVEVTYRGTTRRVTPPIPAAFRGATVRFQAGCYQLDARTGGPATRTRTATGRPPGGAAARRGPGGRVTFYGLRESGAGRGAN